jgi:uncharacterized protein YraI
MLPITQDLLSSKQNRPFLRDPNAYSLRKLKGVVAHWTANTNRGAHAKANRNYFNNTDRYASAHYIVDDRSIIHCIPDNEVAYHVGATRYKADGDRIREGQLSPNYFLVGFEMCVNADGDWNKTYRNSVALAAHLLRKYALNTNDLYRHYDITGKDCPKMMLEESAWGAFKADIDKAMADDPAPQAFAGRVRSRELNVRRGPGTNFAVLEKLPQQAEVAIFEEQEGWLRIGPGRWVSKNFVDIVFETWLGQVQSRTGANVRPAASSAGAPVDALPNTALVHVVGQSGEWLRIGPGRFLHQSLVQRLALRQGKVSGTNTLNTRQGPGTEYKILRRLEKGDAVPVFEEQEGWYRIGLSEWVFGRFLKVIED